MQSANHCNHAICDRMQSTDETMQYAMQSMIQGNALTIQSARQSNLRYNAIYMYWDNGRVFVRLPMHLRYLIRLPSLATSRRQLRSLDRYDHFVPKITVNDWFSALEPTPSSETFLFSEPSAAKCHLSFLSFSQDCSLLSALWVPRTGSASDWCAVRLALYKMNIIISLQLYPISPFQAFWCLMKHASAALLPPLSDLTGNWTCASTGHRLLTNPSDMTQRSQQR